MPNWPHCCNTHRAILNKNIGFFQLQPYLLSCNIIYYIFNIYIKCRCKLWGLWMSAHRRMIKCWRWAKRRSIPLVQSKCNMFQTLEDDFHFVLICFLYYTKDVNIFLRISTLNADLVHVCVILLIWLHQKMKLCYATYVFMFTKNFY